MKVPKERASVNTNRFEREPLEKIFVKEWRKLNEPQGSLSEFHHNRALLGLGPHDPVPARECQVAETVIQWLGSSVGTFFLSEVLAEAKTKGLLKHGPLDHHQ